MSHHKTSDKKNTVAIKQQARPPTCGTALQGKILMSHLSAGASPDEQTLSLVQTATALVNTLAGRWQWDWQAVSGDF